MEVSRRRYDFDRRQQKLELVQSAEWQAMSVQKGRDSHSMGSRVELIGRCRRSCQS